MVRRLIKQQQVWILVENARQSGPHFPPPAQCIYSFSKIRLIETKAGQDLFGLVNGDCPVQITHLLMDLCQPGSRFFLIFVIRIVLEGLFDIVQFLSQSDAIWYRLQGGLQNSAGQCFIDILRQIADAGALGYLDLTFFRGDLSGEQPQ